MNVAEVTTFVAEVMIVRSDVEEKRDAGVEKRGAEVEVVKEAAVGAPGHPEVADRPVKSGRAETIVARPAMTKAAAGVHALLLRKSALLRLAKSALQSARRLRLKLKAGRPSANVD